MSRHSRHALHHSIALFSLSLLTAWPAAAAQYPDKPVRLVVPYPAGGPTDNTARGIGPRLSAALGQPLVIDNRGGAGSIVGSDLVAKSAADGYTLLLFTAANTINPSLIPKLPYDMQKDFAPITLLTVLTSIVVLNPAVPATSVKELIALAKGAPGTLRYASAGNGTPMHLAGELFKTMAGVEIEHIPYKGSAPAIVDLISGQVQLSLIGVSGALVGNIKAGRLRAIAVTNAKRSAMMPELPTLSEAGLPGYESEGWHGLAAPARTPQPIIDRLYREIAAILGRPDMQTYLLNNGGEAGGMPPDQFAVKIRNEIVKWGKVVKAANMKVD